MSRRGRLSVLAAWLACATTLAVLFVGLAARFAGAPALGTGARGWVPLLIGGCGLACLPVIGALLAGRRGTGGYGLVWCALGGCLALVAVAGPPESGGLLPAGAAALVRGYAVLAVNALYGILFLLFPTGRPPSRRWWWVAGLQVALLAASWIAVPYAHPVADPAQRGLWALVLPSGGWADVVLAAGFGGLVLLAVVSFVSVLFRFRRAGPTERQQLKWFVGAGTVIVAMVVTALAGSVVLDRLGRQDLIDLVWQLVSDATFGLLVAAVGVAVLRYRLYEIDRLISRTVSYALLTAALVGVYVGVVTGLRALLSPVIGSSEPAVALSTLAVAAVFRPARRRIQKGVDRRFDRARYDAARIADEYAARLRTQVDLDRIAAGLRETVAATVAPASVEVWLRPERPG